VTCFLLTSAKIFPLPSAHPEKCCFLEGAFLGKQKIVRSVGIAMDESEEQKLKDLANEIIIKLKLERIEQSSQASLFPTIGADIPFKIPNKRGRLRKKKLEDVLPPSQVSLEDIKEEARIIEGVHDIGGVVFDEMYPALFKSKRIIVPLSLYHCSKTQNFIRKLARKDHAR
jgi:hypothetical protein